jgi:hypothetical protein
VVKEDTTEEAARLKEKGTAQIEEAGENVAPTPGG